MSIDDKLLEIKNMIHCIIPIQKRIDEIVQILDENSKELNDLSQEKYKIEDKIRVCIQDMKRMELDT